jgi:hypothetical protein
MEYVNKIKSLLIDLENNKTLNNIDFVSAMNTVVEQLEYHISTLDIIKSNSKDSSLSYNQNINTNVNVNFDQLEQLGKLSNLNKLH